jgi:hypothetical protein
MNSLQID